MIMKFIEYKARILKLKFKKTGVSWSAVIGANVQVFPPVEIGQKCFVENTSLDKNTILCNGSAIRHSYIGKFCKINENASIAQSKIYDFTYVSSGSHIAHATVGKFCSIGPGVHIAGGRHPINFLSSNPVFYSTAKQCGFSFAEKDFFEESKTVVIGNDVWIGAGAYISDGIVIGDGSVIGAGAVLTKSVEPYSIMGGVPAKLIRKRFSDSQIKELLELQWWEWDTNKIVRNLPLFQTSNFDLSKINV